MGSGNFTLKPYLRHFRVGLIVAVVAVIVSVLNGMVAGLGFLTVLKRLPVFVFVFGIFGYGVSYLFQHYLPELLQEFQIKKDKTVPVDISLSEVNPHNSELVDDRALTKEGVKDKDHISSHSDSNKKSDEIVKEAGNEINHNPGASFDKSAKLAQVIRNVINREE